MKNKINYLIIGLLIIFVIILGGIALKNNRSDGYHLSGMFSDQENNFQANVFIMTNNKSNLVNYYIDIPYHKTDVKYTHLYYKENNKKHIVLASALSGYNFEKRDYAIKEFGEKEDSCDKLIKNIDNLYIDLYESYEDSEKDIPFKTIKLTPEKFN